jgi:transcriptional regulator with XRE-family HTH domain
MSLAGRNLRYLRKLRGLTQEEFANKLQIKRSLLGAYEEERADPKLEVLETISHVFKISLDELLLKDLSESQGNYLAKRRLQKLTQTAFDSAPIRFVPIKAAAGYLAGYEDPEFVDELNTFTLPMLTSGNYRAFEIVGDSMLPTPSGSIIVGEKVEAYEDVSNNRAYIVVTRNEGIVYKRVQKNSKLKTKFTLVSDNPVYQPYQVETLDIIEVWSAEYIISKQQKANKIDVDSLANIVTNLQTQVSSLKKKMN